MLNNPTFDQALETLQADPSSSEWLKRTAQWAGQRDPVDALYDAEALLELLKLRLNEVQASAPVLNMPKRFSALLPDLSLG